MTNLESVSDVVAERVRTVRRKRGLTAAALASACAELGAPELTAQALSNIESGRRNADGQRRRFVTVDELMILSIALQVAPVYLLVPPLPDADYPLPVDSSEAVALTHVWQRFIRGEMPLPGMDRQAFLSEVPAAEFGRIIDRIAQGQRAEDGSDG